MPQKQLTEIDVYQRELRGVQDALEEIGAVLGREDFTDPTETLGERVRKMGLTLILHSAEKKQRESFAAATNRTLDWMSASNWPFGPQSKN